MRKFSILLLTAAAVATMAMADVEPRRFLQTILSKEKGKGPKNGDGSKSGKNGTEPFRNGTFELHNETAHNGTEGNHTEGVKGGKEGKDGKGGKIPVDIGQSYLVDLITSYQTPNLAPTKYSGDWTIGYNYTKGVKSTNATITADTALALLQKEVNSTKNEKIECVLKGVKYVPSYINKSNVTVVPQNNLNGH